MALEEGACPVMRRAGEDVPQAELPGIFEGTGQQLAPDPLPLEAGDRVETDDLARPGATVRLRRQGAHPGQVPGTDGGSVAAHQDLGDLRHVAQPQIAFALPALEQALHLQEIVHTQPLDTAVVLECEERARSLVREQLPCDATRVAQVDGVHASEKGGADGLEHGPPVPDARPLCLSPPQKLLQHGAIHEGDESGLVADAAFRVEEYELTDAEPHPEPLGEIREAPALGSDPYNDEGAVAQKAPDTLQKANPDGTGAPVGCRQVPARNRSLHRSRGDVAQHAVEPVRVGSGVRPAPRQDHPGDVDAELRGRFDQRPGIAGAPYGIARHGDQQRLASELVEVETLLAVLLDRWRRPLGAHDHEGSYHTPPGVAMYTPAATGAHGGIATWGCVALAACVFLCALWPARVPAADGVVATEHPLAAAAGLETLRRGGNAVDAALAAAAAVGVVNPLSCGLGGGGFMVVFETSTHTAHALDYREVAPAAATPERFRRHGMDRIRDGPLSVAVPGEPAGLAAAHERFGTLPLGTVLAPAIRYARDGFPIGPHLAEAIGAHMELLQADAALAATFLHDDGTPRREGEPLRQPALAQTLERLGAEGAAAFYRGAVAGAIADTIDARGGILTLEDLAGYRVRWRAPLRGRYRGRSVFTMPPPGSGGVVLAILNVLSAYDLAALGGPTSPTYLHLLAEVMKAAFADRARFYGDPDFVDVPVERLTSAEHANASRAGLSAIRVRDVPGGAVVDAGTAHVSVLDGAGNAAAVTTTSNTALGSGSVAAGTGIVLNNEMADFSLAAGSANVFGLVATSANVVGPHRRPLSSMSPTIVVRDDRPEIVVGGSGGPMIISGTVQTLLGLIDFARDPEAAAAAPRIHHQGIPPLLLVEPGIPAATRQSLSRIGHTVRTAPVLGAVSVVQRGARGVAGAGAPGKGGGVGVHSDSR